MRASRSRNAEVMQAICKSLHDASEHRPASSEPTAKKRRVTSLESAERAAAALLEREEKLVFEVERDANQRDATKPVKARLCKNEARLSVLRKKIECAQFKVKELADAAAAKQRMLDVKAEKMRRKEELDRKLSDAGADALVTLCLSKYHSEFVNTSEPAESLWTYVAQDFNRMCDGGELLQSDKREPDALRRRYLSELVCFRLWCGFVNLSGLPVKVALKQCAAHRRPTTETFVKFGYHWRETTSAPQTTRVMPAQEPAAAAAVAACSTSTTTPGPSQPKPTKPTLPLHEGGAGLGGTPPADRSQCLRKKEMPPHEMKMPLERKAPYPTYQDTYSTYQDVNYSPSAVGVPHGGGCADTTRRHQKPGECDGEDGVGGPPRACGGAPPAEPEREPDRRPKMFDDLDEADVLLREAEIDRLWGERGADLPPNMAPKEVQMGSGRMYHGQIQRDDDEYARGNVRLYPGGKTTEHIVDPDVADAIPVQRRQQRSGLVYHYAYDGFEPTSWPFVIGPPVSRDEPSRHCAYLEGASGGYEMLSVEYGYDIDPRLWGCTTSVLEEHKGVRANDECSGGMVGAGDHLRRDGLIGRFVVTNAQARQHVSSALEVAGKIFSQQFEGQGVGYEEMLEEQARLWPNGTPPWPTHWDASWDLGNSMHRDADGARSFAIWMSAKGSAGASRDWWLLFPRHGVAVALAHMACVSWHGAECDHCSSFPDVAPGDELLSLFTSLPANAIKSLQRNMGAAAAMQERMEDGEAVQGRKLFDSLAVGTRVLYKFTTKAPAGASKAARRKWGKDHSRWVRARVAQIEVAKLWLQDDSSGKWSEFTTEMVQNRVVLADSI